MNDRTAAAQTFAHEDSAKSDRASAYRSPIRLEITRGRVLSPWRPQAYGANPTLNPSLLSQYSLNWPLWLTWR
jgi:hypothetical protein